MDRPIIFSAPMVRALLDGRKTQTRRVLTPQPAVYTPRVIDITTPFFCEEEGNWGQVQTIWSTHSYMWEPEREVWRPLKGLRWAKGDRLWVREAHMFVGGGDPGNPIYRANWREDAIARHMQNLPADEPKGWRPSIHMPRWASRLTLAVTEVRVERLQDISRDDAAAEGLIKLPATGRYVVEKGDQYLGAAHSDPRVIFQGLWNSINSPDAWDANPWVAAISFTVHRANIDSLDIGAAA